MKKICALLMAALVFAPVLVHADAYDGPFCYETKVANPPDDPNGVRGTCKEIQIKDVVTLDPSLRQNYFIGVHQPVTLTCGGVDDCSYSKYSEQLTIYSSSTETFDASEPSSTPTEAAVFDKSFFLPLLLSQFKENQFNFSGSDFPPIVIMVYDPAEFNEIKSKDPEINITATDTLQKAGTLYSIDTFSYQKYGKYIWAPQGDLVESQYADLYGHGTMPTSTSLGISYMEAGHGDTVPTVSVTNPLNSITNYWTYSLINNKIALSWQRMDYGFDDGTTKTIASNNGSGTSSSVVATGASASLVQTESTSTPQENIFQRIWDFIASWFK